MEREFKPLVGSPETQAPPPAPERGVRKKEKSKSPEATADKNVSPEAKPHTPEKPPKQKFGARVLNMLFGEPKSAPAETQVSQAEVDKPAVETPEHTPRPLEAEPIERATRMRRFARRVIAHVLGEADAEPGRARTEKSSTPLDTFPLIEAADDLRDASEDLDDTLREAQETLVYERVSTSERAGASPDVGGEYSLVDFRASERIVQRVEQLEAKVETSGGMSLAAVGLGVVAVLVAGHEYLARKRVEKSHKKLDKAHQELEKQVQKQQQEFVVLQKEQSAQMDRQHRQDYYERLSEFTHQQAASTREVSQELQQNIEAALPIIPEPLPQKIETRAETAPRTVEGQPQVEPLRRVETADTIERGGQSGNAGTGFFGGGMSGVGGRIQQALGQVGKSVLPPGKDATTSADAQRKARLASNAWMYSVGFAIAVTALVLSLIFSA